MPARIRPLAASLAGLLLLLTLPPVGAATPSARGIGYVALDLEREAGFPTLDARYAVLDRAVAQAQATLGAQAAAPWTPDQARRIVRTLADLVGTVCTERVAGVGDGRYSTVLDAGACDCDALSLTYLTLAEALGLPLYGVFTPGHMLLRWDDGTTAFLWETTTASEVAAEAYPVSAEARRQGVYLRSLTRRQLLGFLYWRRGNHFYHRQAYPQALADYTRALERDPHLVLAYVNRGETHQALEAYQRAAEDYTRALALDPTEANALYGRGRSFVYLERYDEAIRDFDRALLLNSDQADIHYGRGYARQQLGLLDDAVRDYTAALTRDPAMVQALYNRARAYTVLGEVDQAADDYLAFIERVLHDPAYSGLIPQAQRALLRLRERPRL